MHKFYFTTAQIRLDLHIRCRIEQQKDPYITRPPQKKI